MAVLDTVKKALLIPLSETYADDEIISHIDACVELLVSVGVDDSIARNTESPLVEALVLIYCKTFYGFKNDGSVKELPKSFDMLLKQLSLTKPQESDHVS
jgi:hypothetical protein